MANQEKAVEQLWYAYSRIGLSSGSPGQRHRAASPGLKEIKSERVRNLTYYLRYDLPEGAGASASASNAPVSLIFAQAGQERILIHKQYVGPWLGREGTFFIHVLAGLPQTFSAQDAISLWGAAFWQEALRECQQRESTDSFLSYDDPRRTYLDPLPFDKLLRLRRRDIHTVHAEHAKKIKDYFPIIAEAYLTKKAPPGQPQNRQASKQKPQLYLAAPDHDIALYIAALTKCLPGQLVKNLTFSTYDLDLAPTEIVGVCWLSGAQAEHNPQALNLLDYSKYLQKLTLNCYLPPSELPSLQESQFIEYDPLAAPFAQTATEYCIGKNKQINKRYERFLQSVERIPNITIKHFFQLYEEFFSQETRPYHDLEEALIPETAEDLPDTEHWLTELENRMRLLNRAIGHPEWWQSRGRSAVIALGQYPTLALVLSQVGDLAISYAVLIAAEEAHGAAAALAERKKVEKNIGFGIVIDVMYCAAPPERNAKVWVSLYDKLEKIDLFFDFLRSQPEVHTLLIRIWEKTLPHQKELSPASARRELSWLPGISTQTRRNLDAMLPNTWLDFGASLMSDSPLSVSERAAKKLLHSTNLTAGQAYELAESYHTQIKTFLYQLAQTQVPASQSLARDVFNALRLAAYPEKIDLLYDLLKSAMVVQEDDIARLLKLAELSPDENMHFFALHGTACLKNFPQSQTLRQHIQQLLVHLPNTDLSVFQRSSSPEETTPIEELLWFLVEAQLPEIEASICYHWYNAGCAIRKPELFKSKAKVEIVAVSMGYLLWSYTFSEAARTKLFRALAEICIAAQNSLGGVIKLLYGQIVPENLWLLLHTIAELAGSQLQWNARKTVIEYILFALQFSTNFRDKYEQWLFVQSFLNTLLKDVDDKLLGWIRRQMRKQRLKDMYIHIWNRFSSQFVPLPVPELFWLEHRRFNHERNKALKRFKQAIKDDSLSKIGQVAIEYATTLSQHKTLLSTEELKKAKEAIEFIDRLEEQELWRYQQRNPPPLYVVEHGPPPAMAHVPANALAQPWRLKRWWRRRVELAQVGAACRSASIGRIVLAKKLNRELLEQYRTKKRHWWERIDGAERFFNAFQTAEALSNGTSREERMARELNVAWAGDAIEELGLRSSFAPRLNVHEYVRWKTAGLYRERQLQYATMTIKREYRPLSMLPAQVSTVVQP